MHLPLEDDDRPPYVQAAEVLRSEIARGRLKPGDKLPSARTLQESYGIASSTVQNALRVLKAEGLIYSVQGRGSYVRQATAPAPDKTAAPTSVAPGPGPLTRPDASDEFNELASQVHALSTQVAQLKTLVQELLRSSGKPDAG